MKNTSAAQYKPVSVVLLLFAFSLPLSKTLNTTLMGLVYVYLLATAATNRDFRKAAAGSINQPLVLPIVLYILVPVIGLFTSEDMIEGLRRIKTVSNLLLVYMMVSTLLDLDQDASRRDRRGEQLLLSLLAGLFMFDLVGFSEYFGITGDRAYTLPLAPLGVHHIWFANLNAVGLYAAASLLPFSTYRRLPVLRASLALLVVFSCVSMLLSTSRTAWLGLAVVVPLAAFLGLERRRHFLVSMLLLVGAALLLYLFNSTVHTRVTQIFSDISGFYADSGAATSVGGRLMMWKASWKMFLSNPLFGVGTGDYSAVIRRYVESGEFPPYLLEFNQPHNIFVFALATNGLPGLAAVLYLFCSIVRLSKGLVRSDSGNRLFGFVALATAVHFMAAGLADSLLHIHALLCTFAFVMGVCLRRSVTEKSRRGETC